METQHNNVRDYRTHVVPIKRTALMPIFYDSLFNNLSITCTFWPIRLLETYNKTAKNKENKNGNNK